MLTAGTHTLTSFDADSLNHCILVKLTDTSAKYIQEFIKRNDANKRTSVKFSKEKGEIIFSNINQDHNKAFHFGVSSIKGMNKEATASFECVSYINKRLESVSAIEEKITIQATDDAFQATKEKVTSVAEEEKKNSTIEIKSSTNNRNRSSKSFKRLQNNAKSPVKPTNPIVNNNNHKVREQNINNGSLPSSSSFYNKPIPSKPSVGNVESKATKPANESSFNDNHSVVSKTEKSPATAIIQPKINENVFQTIESLSKYEKMKEEKKAKEEERLAAKQNSPQIAKKEVTVDLVKQTGKLEINNTQPKTSEIESTSFWDSIDLNDIIKSDTVSSTQSQNSSNSNNNANNALNKTKEKNENSYKQNTNTEEDWMRMQKIDNLEDRKKLKVLFDKLHPEYIELHNYLEQTSKIFCNYQDEIELCKKNSKEYQQLSERIIKEFNTKMADSIYSNKNQRYHDLYTKLEHFHNLVRTFDENSNKSK